jgi:Ca2+-binding RTX toxin-like protein
VGDSPFVESKSLPEASSGNGANAFIHKWRSTVPLFKGSPGIDHLSGTEGDDTFIGFAGADVFDGFGGSDFADYTSSPASVQVTIGIASFGGDAQGDVFHSIENVIGSKFVDVLNGDTGANRLNGGEGNDFLFGNGDDDVLTGGFGEDRLSGGAGIDTADYSTASGVGVRLDLESTIEGFGGDAFGDDLKSIEHIVGSSFGDSIGIGNLAGFKLDAGGGNDVIGGKAGSQTINGQDGNDRLDGGAGGDTLDGGNGIDTLDYTHSTLPVTVNLSTKVVSGGDAEGDTILGFEDVLGSSGGDSLTGSSVANQLAGFSGSDKLSGLGGRDSLAGGLGSDTFLYTGVSDSGVGAALRDLVQDFSRAESDRIDLSAIDAISGGPNDAFKFIDKAEFSAPGQVRFFAEGTHTIVEINNSGAGGAEMQIELNNLVTFQSVDFIL